MILALETYFYDVPEIDQLWVCLLCLVGLFFVMVMIFMLGLSFVLHSSYDAFPRSVESRLDFMVEIIDFSSLILIRPSMTS